MSKPIHKQNLPNASSIEALEKRIEALEAALKVKPKVKPKVNKGEK